MGKAMTTTTQSYFIKGGDTGVLLLHGLCGSPTEMRFVANSMARAGHTVYCPQLAGHCGSEDELKASTWQDWYASAEAALTEMHKTCSSVIVGGLSTGALLALKLAADRPDEVNGLALFTPTLWLNGFQIPWYMKLFRLVTIKQFAHLFRFATPDGFGIKDERIREFIRKAAGTPGAPSVPVYTPGGAALERWRLAKTVMRLVSRISQPTIILHPREDDYAGLSNAVYLQKNLGGVVDLVVLDDSYHLVTIDRQRHIVVERTLSFIDRMVKTVTASQTAAAPLRPAMA
jgi:carboxylesterase